MKQQNELDLKDSNLMDLKRQLEATLSEKQQIDRENGISKLLMVDQLKSQQN